MTTSMVSLQHVNVRVHPSVEDDAKQFYGELFGLQEIPKPLELRGNGGAWYQLGSAQLHLSRDAAANNEGSKRHICFHVENLDETRKQLANAGVEIIPDDQPVPGSPRFYVRDPGGNLIEVAQASR